MRRVRWQLMIFAAGALLLFLGLSVAFGGQENRDVGTRSNEGGAAAVAARFFVDPLSDAAEQERRWMAEGRPDDARAIRAISRRPGAEWYGEPDRNPVPVRDRVERLTTKASAAGAVPVIVIYSIPFRDCGSFSSGGSVSGADYQRYVGGVAEGIAGRRALVVLEPDAAAHSADGCVSGPRSQERLQLLRTAIEILKAGRLTRVYLDAGNAGFIPAAEIAPILRRAGIARADGLAVNVANFHTTRSSVAYGRAISRRVGGKPFVVDTSRNGNGPWRSDDPQSWCNPPGRALGRPPTANTGDQGVDAFLWIKGAGDSDGTCRAGPRAGEWWPEYALALARAGRG